MAYTLKDRVVESSTSVGLGDFVLAGAQDGYQSFSVVGNGTQIPYTIQGKNPDGTLTAQWEVGIGTYYSAGTYITRDTVLESSNANAKVNFAAGAKDVYLDMPGELLIQGPDSATASDFVAFDGTSGKIIKDSGFSSASFATAAQGAKADTAVQPGSLATVAFTGAYSDLTGKPTLGTAAALNAGVANGVATLDSGGTVPISQLPSAVLGALSYQGTWNASTNTPTLTSSVGTKGYYYVVNVAGTTNLNGITDWVVGDWAVYNGTAWQKIDNTDAVTSVNGYTGTVVLTYTDVGAQPAGTYVTSVSGTAPVVSSGGTTPAISMHVADATHDGYLSSTDWSAFNSKVTMTYPPVGIPYSTGTAWGTSYTTTGSGTIVALQTGASLNNPTISNYVDFGNGSATTLAAGRMWYDSTTGSWNLGMGGGNITQQVGEEQFIYGKASAAITEGQLIVKTGANGASGVITFAPSPANLTDNDGIIGVATENIALNGFGRITTFGVVHGINTTGASVGETWADGDTLWYNPAGSGKLTNVKPTAPNIKFAIATVTHAGPGGSGSIQVDLQPGSVLGGTDANVQMSTPSNGQILTYDGTNTYWKNTTLTAGTAISVSASSGGVLTITNTAPDQTVTLTGAGTTTVTGTYPNFTITSNDQYTGTVTSVTGTSPISVATGTTTPVVSMTQANTSTNGWLSSTDWNTFNNKQPAGTYVTAVTVVSANGFTGSSSGGATPALTLGTSVTGLLKGNGTAISAATSGTDYAPATSGSSILYGNGAGGFSNVTIGSGLTFAAGTLSASGGGLINAVTGTAPISVTTTLGTANVSISQATTSTNGYLSSTDWNTFNNKGSGTVTSITAGTYLTGGTITTSGTIAVDATTTNTASKVVARDASGNFAAGTITASLTGNVTGNVSGSAATFTSTTQDSQFNSIGVGTAASTTAGQIRATGNITAFYSDARLKDFKGTIPNALQKVQALNGYYFTGNETAKSLGYDNKEMQVGVSAQEVEAILPEVVTDAPINANFEGADYKTVYYDKLVPLLIEAIKELKAEIDTLKGK